MTSVCRAQDGLSRLYGCVAGCAVGDALGAPLEGMRRDEIAPTLGRVEDFVDLADVPRYREQRERLLQRWRLPGAHTDDTQQFLAILDTWSRHGGITGELLASTFAELFDVSRGTGRGYREFCKAIRSGSSWREATPPTSGRAGCGSAMRAGAVGLLLRDSLPELLRVSVLQSCVTHTDLRAHLAAFLIASTVGWAIHSSPDSLKTLEGLRTIHEATRSRLMLAVPVVLDICARERVGIDRARERSQQFLGSLDSIAEVLAECNELAHAKASLPRMLDRIAAAAAADRVHKFPPTGTLNFALEAPIAAYATFLLFGTNFREAVLTAIHLGGDADSVGAMVGQMTGSLVGFDPVWWRYEPILHEDERPSFRATARDERALASVPPEWFMKLQLNFGLLRIVASIEQGRPVDLPQPDGLPINALQFTGPWLAQEEAICNLERATRKKVKADAARRQHEADAHGMHKVSKATSGADSC